MTDRAIAIGRGAIILLAVALMRPAARAYEADPISWLSDNQDRFPAGLVESQVGFSDHRAFTYDQALAAILFTKSGYWDRARSVFDTLEYLQEPVGGYWRTAYRADTGNVWGWGIDTGSIAWVVIAVNYYESRTRDDSYADMAGKAIGWLETRIDKDPASRSYGALNLGTNMWDIPNSESVYATEHQLDAYSAFKNRAVLTTNSTLKSRLNSEAADILLYLVREPWDGDHFSRGFDDPEKWLDCQSWAAMSLGRTGPNGEDFCSALDYAENNMVAVLDYNDSITHIEGFSYNNYQETIWVEGTLQMADAYFLFDDAMTGDYYLNEMSRIARSDGGLSYSFDESGTAEDNWPTNLRYSAASSAAWFYFAQTRLNPFAMESLVPSIVGLTQSSAESAITSAGLVVGTETLQCSYTVPAGRVISQSPAAGVSVAFGSAVVLVISRGPAIYVDGVSGNDSTGTGARASPYKTVQKALQVARNGDRIIILAGTYPENITMNKQVTIEAQGGLVRIGR